MKKITFQTLQTYHINQGTIVLYFSKVLNYFDYFFTCVFTLEILIKVTQFLYFRYVTL